MIGICSYGGFVPRLRLERSAIYQAMGWFAPATMAVAQGERSFCNWDEDSLTMAVAACRDCLRGFDRRAVDALFLCSTTLPFADRQNAGVVKSALNLRDDLLTNDLTASLKAGTSGLITALDAVRGGERRRVLVAAADKRQTRAASFYEMWYGDGAAALLVGDEGVIAELLGSHSVSHDFVDHFRGDEQRFDYTWEERWVRDEGYSKIVPEAVSGLLARLKLTMGDVDRLIFPCFFKAEHARIAKALGAAPAKVADNLHDVCGETGAAHPLFMLGLALQEAKPGERILVAGFGQGCDALLFRVTDAIAKLPPRSGPRGALARKKTVSNYPKFLKFRDLITTESGIRAEAPTQTALTTLWRRHKMILGLVGGRCTKCGTPQFPRSDVCVNPECRAVHSQEDFEFAERPAKVKTFTGDYLAVSVDPPAIYGMIEFEGGGRFMADLSDCELDDVFVGQPVEMHFRRRYADAQRGFAGYFWKAVPLPGKKPARREDEIRFDGQVAVVTGAGGGLGRVYALELARRGARVVVNDVGGARDGSGEGSRGPADKVVLEIAALGGEAVASYDSIATEEGGKALIERAVAAFGRIDVLIHNAGILRDKSLLKMEKADWDAVMAVHLDGAYHVCRPALQRMREQGYGRIVLSTSAAGLFGNFGQTNYAAAKLGLVGFMNTLKLEGAKHEILVNTVAPIAATRLTQDVLPPDLFERMKPEYVASIVIYLCSKGCDRSGMIFNAGLGVFTRAAMVASKGVLVGDGRTAPTPEDIRARWGAIHDLAGAEPAPDAATFLGAVLASPEPRG